MFHRLFRIWLLAFAALAFAGFAAAQAEPTLSQIYATAQSGQLDKARQMTQEVLRNHPQSAKAHFVMAELDAAQGNVTAAREQLAQAESLAPGLPFARPEAVQALRERVNAKPTARSTDQRVAPSGAPAPEAPRSPSFPWGLVLLGGAVVAGVAWMLRSRAAARSAKAPGYMAGGAAAARPGWDQQPPGYGPQPGYGPAQPAQPGMGGNIMGGLATGLAVGAGALAAQEIGRRMLADHPQQGAAPLADSHPASDSSLASDAGIGSIGRPDRAGSGLDLPQDFGIQETGSWDDAGSFDGGGGGDWDT